MYEELFLEQVKEAIKEVAPFHNNNNYCKGMRAKNKGQCSKDCEGLEGCLAYGSIVYNLIKVKETLPNDPVEQLKIGELLGLEARRVVDKLKQNMNRETL